MNIRLNRLYTRQNQQFSSTLPVTSGNAHRVTLIYQEARELARNNSLGNCIQYICDLTQRIAPQGLGLWKPRPEMTDDECNLDYFMDEVVIAGDPERVTELLLELRDQVGAFGSLVLTAHDWDDAERWRVSQELFAREVVPRFNRAIGASG